MTTDKMITDLIADIDTDEKTAAIELSFLHTNKQLGREHVLDWFES